MDLISALQQLPNSVRWLPYVITAIAIAAIILPYLPVPTTKTGAYYIIWQIINRLAQNHLNAKSKYEPDTEAAQPLSIVPNANQMPSLWHKEFPATPHPFPTEEGGVRFFAAAPDDTWFAETLDGHWNQCDKPGALKP